MTSWMKRSCGQLAGQLYGRCYRSCPGLRVTLHIAGCCSLEFPHRTRQFLPSGRFKGEQKSFFQSDGVRSIYHKAEHDRHLPRIPTASEALGSTAVNTHCSHRFEPPLVFATDERSSSSFGAASVTFARVRCKQCPNTTVNTVTHAASFDSHRSTFAAALLD